MVSSDLMEPRILRCMTISRSPRSAALLVGGMRGSRMNPNRSSYALPSLVRNFCRSSQSVRILRIPRMRLRRYLYSLRLDSNVSLSSAWDSDIFWASVPASVRICEDAQHLFCLLTVRVLAHDVSDLAQYVGPAPLNIVTLVRSPAITDNSALPVASQHLSYDILASAFSYHIQRLSSTGVEEYPHPYVLAVK